MKRLVPLLLVLVAGCNCAYQGNNRYMQEVSARFESGQSLAEVEELLTELGAERIELFNPCSKEYADESTPCGHYRLTAFILLPIMNWGAGVTAGQMQFSFGPDKMLGQYFYSVAYKSEHHSESPG